ncbi:hypothetical protein L2E82_43550 [Cichorium intybus]|uniref:Uncharacterized protein n=1 Tax=Cichorium intybus TaxID=13427 RepID=A0ACB8ZQ20_CICIN|nr:hypothetical protein L2E82_43550 [Cichorium intybus]
MGAPSSTNHFRSTSLPSRLTPPSCSKTATKIHDLKELENLVGTTETIQSRLIGLAELYVSVNELLGAPETQQALSRHQNGTLVQAALEGSIGFLDSCSTLKDMIVLMKENVQTLQSALRRKGGDSTVASQIEAYLCFRKKAKKAITKSLATLKHPEKKRDSFLFVEDGHHGSSTIKVLKEANALTISLFKSILIFVSTKAKTGTRVQLISKLVATHTSTQEHNHMFQSEVETIDLALMLLHKNMRKGETKDVDIQMTRKRLQNLNPSLEGFEDGLDYLFRGLIRSRASLLNILVC